MMKARFVDAGNGGFQLIMDFDATDLEGLEKAGRHPAPDASTPAANLSIAGVFGSDYYCITVNGGDGHHETIKTWGPWAYARGYAIMRDHNGVGFQLTNGKCAGD